MEDFYTNRVIKTDRGADTRSFIHIDEAVSIIASLMNKKPYAKGFYNVATNEEVMISTLALMIQTEFMKHGYFGHVEFTGTQGERRFYVPSVEPRIGIVKGVGLMVEHYLNNVEATHKMLYGSASEESTSQPPARRKQGVSSRAQVTKKSK
jgi:nucleoside-diphosphate-sugar epimerase